MVASSAASERNFSAFAHIHTKLRNRLSDDVVEKLVYVRTNNMQLMKQDAKQRFGGVGQLTCFEDEEGDYIDIESDGDSCQSTDVGS